METISNKSDMSKFEAAIWFWVVVGFFAAMWILLPSLFHTGYRNDVIEMQSIAPEWVWSTKKLPNLPAWILEILNILTSRSFAVPFIASQLCTILALWSVWRLGRTVLSERLALVGVFAILPYRLFTSESVLYNHNNVLLAFWCLSIYLTCRAFQTNQKRYWISAGIALGLAFHAKYSVAFLVVAILAYMFVRKEGRKYIGTPGPYITTVVAFVMFLPHIVWLVYHDFAPFYYASDRPLLSHWYQQILTPFSFAVRQLIYWIPTLIILIPIIGFVWQWKIQRQEQSKAKECEKFIFYCFMIPLVGHMLFCLIQGSHLRMAYGAPFWGFLGLWLVLRFQTDETIQRFRQAVMLAITVGLLIIAGWLVTFYSGKQLSFVYYPIRDLGTTCERIWVSHSSGHCSYVAGDQYLIGFVAHTMSVRPSVILSPQGTWANDDDLNQKGGMIVWERQNDDKDMPESLRQRFPSAEVLPEAPELSYKIGSKIHILKLGIAIVPPPETP